MRGKRRGWVEMGWGVVEWEREGGRGEERGRGGGRWVGEGDGKIRGGGFSNL